MGPILLMPALLTSTSSRPNSVTAASARRWRSSRRVTSVARLTARPPRSRICCASWSRRSVRRAPSTTAAPRSASSRAVASPMPLLAPVTATTLPLMPVIGSPFQ